MIDKKEISSLIYLLDDSDEEVVEQIESKILSFGFEAIPFLEEASVTEQEVLRLQRMQRIIRELKKTEILRDLNFWKQHDNTDLLKGLLILERVEFPHTNIKDVQTQLEKIRLDAWLEFNYDLTSFEQVKILNYIFFKVHNFKGNAENYHDIENSCISKVLENRTGNPVSLGIIYSLIAQRLNIPVYGVNLPQHFVLGYKNIDGLEILKSFNDESTLSHDDDSKEVMFYINPFTEGLILNAESIRSFLKQLQVESKPEYFNVCSNVEILKRVMRNMLFSYEKVKQHDKSEIIQKLLESI